MSVVVCALSTHVLVLGSLVLVSSRVCIHDTFITSMVFMYLTLVHMVVVYVFLCCS